MKTFEISTNRQCLSAIVEPHHQTSELLTVSSQAEPVSAITITAKHHHSSVTKSQPNKPISEAPNKTQKKKESQVRHSPAVEQQLVSLSPSHSFGNYAEQESVKSLEGDAQQWTEVNKEKKRRITSMCGAAGPLVTSLKAVAVVFLNELPELNAVCTSNRDLSSSANYVHVPQITAWDVTLGINKLKPGSSIGPDCIPPWFLKEAKTILVHPLCHLFNISLQNGIYPSQWKLSRVTPIPKNSNKESVEEYRPIAVLPTMAKVFEHVLHRKLYREIEPFLCNEQHGFRKKRSVHTNLLTLVDYISSKLDCGTQVDVLYFDFRKAFDRVNNDILLKKLRALGLTPGFLRFMADFLRDRQQFVRLGLYDSSPYHTRSGVSQGSVVGPLLFTLMINDLPAVIEYAKCLLYADDLKLYMEIKTIEDCFRLQKDIDKVYEWSVKNKMEFNSSKCIQMTFGRKRHPIEFHYKLGQDIISRVTSAKDLGVSFDRELTFNSHIVTVLKESYGRLGFVLRNSRGFQNIEVIKLIFSALVRSKLEACACIWHPHEDKYTLMLEKVQKAFLRYLYKRKFGYYPYMYPTDFLHGTLGYNSLEVRRAYDQLGTMCKILRGQVDAPELTEQLSRLYVPDNYRRCRKHKLFAVPSCRTVAHKSSPIPRSLATLNALLDFKPECDLFAGEWRDIMADCLKHCETTLKRQSTVCK